MGPPPRANRTRKPIGHVPSGGRVRAEGSDPSCFGRVFFFQAEGPGRPPPSPGIFPRLSEVADPQEGHDDFPQDVSRFSVVMKW